jgi:hypothetical protein
MPRTRDTGFDGALVDRDEQTVALVEVKSNPVGALWTTLLPRNLARYGRPVDFVLAIDPVHILLYRPTGTYIGEPLVILDTPEVLNRYDPESSRKRIFESYMLTLVEAWLRDLAYHWKSENPPGADELRQAGLLDRIKGGTTEPLGA